MVTARWCVPQLAEALLEGGGAARLAAVDGYAAQAVQHARTAAGLEGGGPRSVLQLGAALALRAVVAGAEGAAFAEEAQGLLRGVAFGEQVGPGDNVCCCLPRAPKPARACSSTARS